MAKPKVPNAPNIRGADGRTYMNPAYYGFPDPDNQAARILEQMIAIKARADSMNSEIRTKLSRIRELEQQRQQDNVCAVLEDRPFADISEIAALKDDVEQLQERVRAARLATETLAGQLHMVQKENAEKWTKVLADREGQLMDEYAKVEAKLHALVDLWRQHASLCESVTGERQFLDFAHPTKPIILRDPHEAQVISSRTARSNT